MKFLHNVKANTPTRSIKFLLHKHLSGPETARPLSRIHASELTKPDGLCARMYALSDVTKTKPKDGWLTTSEQVTFGMGRHLQDDVVNWFADMGKAVGHWRCVACNSLHEFCKRPLGCKVCGTKVFKPGEVRFESAKNGASCGIDTLLALGELKLRPVEIKTMDKDQFKALVAPLAEHRLRTNLYLRLIDESDSPWSNLVATDVATVLYVSKGGYGCADPQLKTWGLSDGFSPFKEFDIQRHDADTNVLATTSKQVKDFRSGKIGMPKGICTTAMSKRAIACPRKGVCFSGEYPPGEKAC